MSEFKRLQRLLKSLIPSFSNRSSSNYQYEDATLMINDLSYTIQPEKLEYLLSRNEALYEFIQGVEKIEIRTGKSLINDVGTIDSSFQPQGHEEGDRVWFTITYKGKERTIASYIIR